MQKYYFLLFKTNKKYRESPALPSWAFAVLKCSSNSHIRVRVSLTWKKGNFWDLNEPYKWTSPSQIHLMKDAKNRIFQYRKIKNNLRHPVLEMLSHC